MEWFEDEVRALEGSSSAPAPGQLPVAFYGSSSIRLWGSLTEDFPGLRVVNLGFGGSTLAACAHFFRRIVIPRRPRALVVYAGDNDLGDGHSPEQVLESLRALLHQTDQLLGPIPVAFLSIKPSPARWHLNDQIRRANDSTREEITRRPGGRFIDVYPLMLGHDGRPRPELYEPDGLHLTSLGYRLWAREITAHAADFF
ncbi:GDSL-type esterase/lipase family protein [Zavarzinella formosa]|uniref:GDSL-type esterase/lipase family protein n=1 Tax=Zavarzinella formosa TaxID=360055 RepID=UPI00030039FB|nr:GDSL-type esterase/lipase family protein [Zavarzinella formosa]